jgi:hypothetical protein
MARHADAPLANDAKTPLRASCWCVPHEVGVSFTGKLEQAIHYLEGKFLRLTIFSVGLSGMPSDARRAAAP